MTVEISKVFWQQVASSKYARSLTNRMLSNLGDEIFSVTTLVGLPAHQRMQVFVVYDKSYVIQWLIVKVIQKLQPISKEQLIGLINEAWDVYRENQSNGVGASSDVSQGVSICSRLD